ncbi:MAG: ABC transporter permease DevC [Cyanophyceae cyanobacterium]
MFLKTLLTFWQLNKPLGWSQLSHQKVRLAVAMTGVAFSSILIFTQLGLRAQLFSGITLLPENLAGDLYLLSAYAPIIDWGSFPRIYLYQADAVTEVATASPLYVGEANWVNPEDLQRADAAAEEDAPQFEFFPNQVKVLAFNPARPVFKLPEVSQQLERLSVPGSVLFDRLSQDQLGPIPQLLETGTVTTIMDNRTTYVVGLFSLGSTFFDKGHVIMSDWNYARWQGQEKLEQVTVGVLSLEPEAEITEVQQRLQAELPDSVKVLTRQELLTAEQEFRASFPEGKILNFGAAIGFIVGLVVVYQVLYMDINDHLPEYATLKAMGYSDRALLAVVLQEAVILGLLGFVPGFLSSYGVYSLLTRLTKIPLAMRSDVTVQVFVLILAMCILSGAIAMNKLRSADPADVF